MQKQAAVKIDRHIGKTDAPMPEEAEKKPHADQRDFKPWQSTRRKRGTGCVYQINDHLWEGKYTPRNADGKRISRSVVSAGRESPFGGADGNLDQLRPKEASLCIVLKRK